MLLSFIFSVDVSMTLALAQIKKHVGFSSSLFLYGTRMFGEVMAYMLKLGSCLCLCYYRKSAIKKHFSVKIFSVSKNQFVTLPFILILANTVLLTEISFLLMEGCSFKVKTLVFFYFCLLKIILKII